MTQDLTLRVSKSDALDVRTFKVDERIGAPFTVELIVRSPNPDLDLEALVGEAGRFEMAGRRAWAGVVRAVQLVRAEPAGLSTYRIELVPKLWLLTQRRNHRIFQRMTEPDMALELLSEWSVPFEARIDRASYKKRDYRVQYAESDFAFVSRMLEDAGITYWFETPHEDSILVLSDAPHTSAPRRPIEHVDDASDVPPGDFATKLTVTRELRPGKYTVRDVDFRMAPTHRLLASSSSGDKAVEAKLESFHYVPGAFLFEGQGGDTPSADDKLAARTSEREAELLAQRRLDAKRGESLVYAFSTNAFELGPGARVGITGHPRSDLGADHPLLITHIIAEGEATGRWSLDCRARKGDIPFRPPLATAKPKTTGIETATVVGPEGEEIHTDEFGRVRVHFHWDRQSRMNDDSSCWLPVSQPWAGTAFGGINLPRVGQEVIVDFLGGDPDRPMITGRVYTAPQPVPFKLPDNKTQSGWKSNSTNKTGGYNEIMFEDKAGQELVRIQAEKDLHKLVKNDEESSVGHDRTRDVKRNETVTIGNNRTHRVVANERINVGQNQSVVVGINRSTQVGSIDSTVVGETFVFMVAPPGEMAPPGDAPHSDSEDPDFGKVDVPPPEDLLDTYGKMPTTTTLSGKDGTITVASGKGARVLLVDDTIVLEASNIYIAGRDIGISASSELRLTGGRVLINGPGPSAARIEDKVNTVKILEGSASVFIGGASVPAPPKTMLESLNDEQLAAADEWLKGEKANTQAKGAALQKQIDEENRNPSENKTGSKRAEHEYALEALKRNQEYGDALDSKREELDGEKMRRGQTYHAPTGKKTTGGGNAL